MLSDRGWAVIGRLPNHAEAEVVKLLLEAEGVPAKTEPADSIDPLSVIWLLVESDLVHRARWILKDDSVSVEELEFLATGQLPRDRES